MKLQCMLAIGMYMVLMLIVPARACRVQIMGNRCLVACCDCTVCSVYVYSYCFPCVGWTARYASKRCSCVCVAIVPSVEIMHCVLVGPPLMSVKAVWAGFVPVNTPNANTALHRSSWSPRTFDQSLCMYIYICIALQERIQRYWWRLRSIRHRSQW